MLEYIGLPDRKDFGQRGTVVATGTFDGVHLGHRALMEKVSEISLLKKLPSVLFTFWPHPRLVLKIHQNPLRLLNTREEKLHLLRSAGVDHVVVYPFSEEFSHCSADRFVGEILRGVLNMKVLVVGENHRLGSGSRGNAEMLQELSKTLDFQVEKLSLSGGKQAISSTLIRKVLMAGDIETAERWLGYPYFFSGEVVSGSQVGRQLGFPTANIRLDSPDKLLPGKGVYAVEVLLRGSLLGGMMNIGVRPTREMDSPEVLPEVHLFDFSKDIYGEKVTVYLRNRLRDEFHFRSLQALQEQLKVDKIKAMSLLKNSLPLPKDRVLWK